MKVFLFVFFCILALFLSSVRSETKEKKTKEILRMRICNAKPEYGICKGHRTLWFFNPRRNRCETFVHSNCGGNRNKFFSEEHCINFCKEKIPTDRL